MTRVQELIEEAIAELSLTTVGFINKKWTEPPVGTHWRKGLDLLDEAHKEAGPLVHEEYTYRFATFNPPDCIGGTLNRYIIPSTGNWWVPGSPEPPTGGITEWPNGGGIYPIFHTKYGNGFRLVCDKDAVYPGTGDSRIVRLYINPYQKSYFGDSGIPWEGATHKWRWTWMRPSIGNSGGWPIGRLIEGFGTGNMVNGVSTVGAHFYLDNEWQQTGPFHYYAARQTGVSTWGRYHCPIPFNPDEYHSIEWDVKWSKGADGFMKASTSVNGGIRVEWLDYRGPTLPSNWQSIYGIMLDIRPPLGGPNQELQWFNHRVLIQ